jgi:hypothetical protein
MSDDGGASDRLEQRYAERLLEDETLRSDLTDDEFRPLLDWALDQIHVHATTLAEATDEEADTHMEALTDSLREVLRPLNDAVGARFDLGPAAFADRLRGVEDALRPPLLEDEQAVERTRCALATAVPALAAAKDERDGVDLVQDLVAVLRGEPTTGEGSQ